MVKIAKILQEQSYILQYIHLNPDEKYKVSIISADFAEFSNNFSNIFCFTGNHA